MRANRRGAYRDTSSLKMGPWISWELYRLVVRRMGGGGGYQNHRNTAVRQGELCLKGQCHEIFCFWFFWWISFPPAPEYSIRTVSIFFENSRRYSQVKVHHRYQRHRRQIFPPFSLVLLIPVANWQICHRCQQYRRQICHRCQRRRWQIMGTVSGCRHLKVNLKAKIFIYAYSTTQRCPNKTIQIFQFEDFCNLPPVSTTPVVHLELRIPIGIIRDLGESDS